MALSNRGQHQFLLYSLIFGMTLIFLPALPASAQLVAEGAIWRYLDDGSDQQTAWRQPGFNDSGWASGPAQLGYGDGDEATVISFGGDGSNKHTTTYFRHQFDISGPVDGASLAVTRDDGVIVYLNGTEVFRSNSAPGSDDKKLKL